MINKIRKSFKDMGVKSKLLIAYSIIFVSLLLLSSSLVYFVVKRSIESNIENNLVNATLSIKNMVNTAAKLSIKNNLKAIAENNKVVVKELYSQFERGEITEEEAKQNAENILLSQEIGQTGYIYCISSQGVILIHPNPQLIGVDLTKYDFIREQIKNKEGYIEYNWKNPGEDNVRPKALHMTYFEPWDWIISVSSYRDEFSDLVNKSDFEESVLALKFGDTGYSYVIDSKGNVIIHATVHGNFFDMQDSDGRYFIREICRMKKGRIIYPWQNPGEKAPRDKLVMFSFIPELDWIVASSSYLDEFYRPLTELKFIIVATVLIGLVIILPFTMWLGSELTKPLQKAIKKMAEANEGDFSVRFEAESQDETGKLADSFNEYMGKLERYRNGIQTLNKQLETHVNVVNEDLKSAMDEIKTLRGILPICSHCKKIRDDSGSWNQIEEYVRNHSHAEFTHGICPECYKKLYSDL